MKIRVATSLLTAAGVLACGTPEARYDDKSYGQKEKSEDATQADDPIVDGGAPTGDDLGSDQGSTDLGSIDGTGSGAEDGGTGEGAGDAGADAPGEPEVGDDGDGDVVTKLPPDTLIKHARYRARFETASARAIRDDSGYRNLAALVANQVRAKMTTTPNDGLTLQQTFGDGVARSLTRQAIKSSAGDADRDDGEPTSSHTRLLDRVVGLDAGDCPGVFVCAERMIYKPDEGQALTVCFHDPASGAVKAFPYSAAPNYAATDFTAHMKVYGPYEVRAYTGEIASCKEPAAVPVVTEQIVVDVQVAPADKLGLTLATVDPLTPQYGVQFENRRVANDLVAPYIDETVRLNHRTVYGLNETARELAKLVVTTRMSIDIAAQAGGGLLGGLAGLLVNIDGVIVDLHMEYCQNLLEAGAKDKCAP